jgi:Bacteriophage Lambda NinG protein
LNSKSRHSQRGIRLGYKKVDGIQPKKKPKLKHKSIAKLRDEAWKHFSIYIRTKYANDKGEVQCVTCKKWLRDWDYKGLILPGWKAAQAGHFIPGRRPSVLFDERNVHPQCGNCNVYLHGNLIAYYPFMQQTYGEEVIKELKQLHYTNKQFTTIELQELIDRYKQLNQ